MVKGLESFIEQFREFPNCYTVIGGAACDILMTEAGLEFRATKDIDMILVLEGDFPGFGHKFWEYIAAAGKIVSRFIFIASRNRSGRISQSRLSCFPATRITILKYRRASYRSILMMRPQVFPLSCWMIITTG